MSNPSTLVEVPVESLAAMSIVTFGWDSLIPICAEAKKNIKKIEKYIVFFIKKINKRKFYALYTPVQNKNDETAKNDDKRMVSKICYLN